VIIFPICPVEDEEILASSSRPDTSPAQVRLDSGSAWVRAEDDRDGYVQIDLRYPDWASGVITMGWEGRDEYVTEYRVFYSMDGNNWDQVNNGGFFSRPMIFEGNQDDTSNNTVIFPELFIFARFWRIQPIYFHNAPALRFDVLVCRNCPPPKPEPPETTTPREPEVSTTPTPPGPEPTTPEEERSSTRGPPTTTGCPICPPLERPETGPGEAAIITWDGCCEEYIVICVPKFCPFANHTVSCPWPREIFMEIADEECCPTLRCLCPEECPPEPTPACPEHFEVIEIVEECGCVRHICIPEPECTTCMALEMFTSPEQSIGFFREDIPGHGTCVNIEPVLNVRECNGYCASHTTYSEVMLGLETKCNCCKPDTTRSQTVTLTCRDGYSEDRTYELPTSCSCSPCGGDVTL